MNINTNSNSIALPQRRVSESFHTPQQRPNAEPRRESASRPPLAHGLLPSHYSPRGQSSHAKKRQSNIADDDDLGSLLSHCFSIIFNYLDLPDIPRGDVDLVLPDITPGELNLLNSNLRYRLLSYQLDCFNLSLTH
jgi:hypothetical protein